MKFFFHPWHKTASSVEAGTAAVNSWAQSLPCPEGSISQPLSDLPSLLFILFAPFLMFPETWKRVIQVSCIGL